MTLEPDPRPGHDAADPDPVPSNEPEPQDLGCAPGTDEAPARSRGDRLSALYRQWATPGRPTGDALLLVRTTPEDPGALPYLDLLGVEPHEIVDAWSAWSDAQLASDATPIGRALRPLVGLVPAGGRWTAARSVGAGILLEPIDHPTPFAALRAAEMRYRLVVAHRVDEVLDILGDGLAGRDEPTDDAALARGDEPAPAADADAATPDGEPATGGLGEAR